MKMFHCVAMLALALPTLSNAQQTLPRVLLDTTQGPIILELDNVRAPRTSANFLAYVDDGSFNDMIVQRVEHNFVIQSGSYKSSGMSVASKGTIPSERGNGLSNTYGKVAMALSSTITGQINVSSASSAFYINTGDNSSNLDANFTAFGSVVYGFETLDAINQLAAALGFARVTPLIRRAVRVDDFPILDFHTGAWFDPANSGRGFALEISRASGGSAQPLAIVNWYDYSEGKQIWLNGAIPFQWGDSSVTVPMQITSGAQFGNAFAPEQVESDLEWGTLTIRFSDCHHGEFSFQSKLGNATYQLTRITEPTHIQCLND